MSRMHFDRSMRAGAFFAALLLAGAATLHAQAPPAAPAPPGATPPAAAAQAPQRVVSSEVTISRDEATLELELEDGRSLEFALRDGDVEIDGRSVGSYRRGDQLDRAWRELLNSVIDLAAEQIAATLVAWQGPPGAAGQRLDQAFETGLAAGAASAAPSAPGLQEPDQDRLDFDSLRDELRRQIRAELQRELGRGGRRGADFWRPVRAFWGGVIGLISMIVFFALLAGIGLAVVFFGRTYVEGVADTVRRATLRSFLVGFAGSFLVLPVYVIVIVALAISIIGIIALPFFVVLFPVAVVFAIMFGYFGAAHASGEALAERRFYGSKWFQHANSYYYILTGLALLFALWVLGQIFDILPWLEFVHLVLHFLALVVTWIAATIGFGAVLISRGGTRAVGALPVATPEPAAAPVLEEEPHV